jgi:uncharacterized LabA/DUF88 family protein
MSIKNNKILIEFHGWTVEYVSDYFILNSLKKKFTINSIEAFFSPPNFFLHENFCKNFINSVKFFLGNFFRLRSFHFFRQIGVNRIFKPVANYKHKVKAINFYKKLYKGIVTKHSISSLKIGKIYVGDILYDSYLKSYNLPTIDVYNKNFIFFLKNFLSLFYYWENYFKINTVKTVIVKHETYLTGLPARIAISKKIKSLVVTNEYIYQLNYKKLYALKQFETYKKDFRKFNKKFKKRALALANKKLLEKFKGSNYHSPYLFESAYNNYKSQKKILKSSDKFKVIIFPHSFIDSPHVYGGSLFCDFYDWLIYILKISKNTNYEWYIKVHPDFDKYGDPTFSIIRNLIAKNPHVNWIDPNVTHNQIIKEGINAALTIHGTVGSEYPFFKIPVINASLNNPHIKYNFNLHPKNINELRSFIYNLPNLKIKLNKRDILEFFFMHKIISEKSWLGININAFTHSMGGLKSMYKKKDSYNLLMSKIKTDIAINNLDSFLDTDDYFFNSYKSYRFTGSNL